MGINSNQRPTSKNFHTPGLKNSQMTKKILIVEDNIDLIQVLSLTLEFEGYEVIWAADGNQALNMAASQLQDLILLDLSLPDMDGLEVARQIRQNQKTHSIPILVTTGRVSFEDKEKCLQSGCDDYISKPFTPKQLVARIEKLLAINREK